MPSLKILPFTGSPLLLSMTYSHSYLQTCPGSHLSCCLLDSFQSTSWYQQIAIEITAISNSSFTLSLQLQMFHGHHSRFETLSNILGFPTGVIKRSPYCHMVAILNPGNASMALGPSKLSGPYYPDGRNRHPIFLSVNTKSSSGIWNGAASTPSKWNSRSSVRCPWPCALERNLVFAVALSN